MTLETLKPIAITVSTNYSDVLPFSLERNIDFLDHWYIITDDNDNLTIDIIKKFNSDKITLLFYKFRYIWYNSHARQNEERFFDKGGAIAMAQKIAYITFPDNWYLVLDTDVLVRRREDLDTSKLDPNKIYGPSFRYDYDSLKNFRIGKEFSIRRMVREENPIIGFFQLYKKKKLYIPGVNTSEVDYRFTYRWHPTNRELLNITVDHLGHWGPGVNCTHNGRVLGNGFSLDT